MLSVVCCLLSVSVMHVVTCCSLLSYLTHHIVFLAFPSFAHGLSFFRAYCIHTTGASLRRFSFFPSTQHSHYKRLGPRSAYIRTVPCTLSLPQRMQPPAFDLMVAAPSFSRVLGLFTPFSLHTAYVSRSHAYSRRFSAAVDYF
ncbi:hypothetical protein VTO73DRAFT_5444 [Trametes versicolor]